MTSIKAVVVNSAKTIASIGSGARWGYIYAILQAQNMMVSGGRDSDVGIGGLVLGGGMWSNFRAFNSNHGVTDPI